MAEEILMGIANKIKEIIPEAEITEAGEKVLITAEHEIGIKGISITIECSTRSIKVKGSREYKYPITDKAVEEFQEEMLSKYPGYSIYVSGQILSYSKVFTYQDELYAINEIKNNIDIIEDAVLTFENDCVNFMEKEVDNKNSSEEYNPEDNINIVNVDNSFHAVSTTEQDNSNYEEQHNNYAKKVFYDLAKRLDADVNGNEMSAVYADDTTIRCVLFPLDAEILVSVSVHATRDIGAMYASYITSNYPELMSSFDEESGLFSVRTYSSPDEYEPEGTQDLLELCITASKACVNEYKQTLEKKDSADFASDVQQILVEQTETVWEREKAVAAREEEMANKEAEMMQREEELNQKLKELEEEKKRIQNEAEEERQKMKDHEAEMEEKIKAYEDRNTKDILNIQQLANQVAALQNRQNALGKVDDKAEEEIFRMKNKVQQLTSQKIALEKKLTEKITGKDAKIRELSDVITQKDSEYKKLESNIDDRVNSRVSDEVKKTDVKIKQLEAELSKIGHILTPEEMIDYLEQYTDAKIAKRHASNAEFVVYNDEALEIRIRFGETNYVDVTREAALKDTILRKLNTKHGDIKFFSKENKITARSYFKKNATVEEVDDLIASLSAHFTK